MISLLRFNVEISEITDDGVAGRFRTMIHREFRDLVIFLEYNSVTFHSDRIFSS
jgi:hypothetical protein